MCCSIPDDSLAIIFYGTIIVFKEFYFLRIDFIIKNDNVIKLSAFDLIEVVGLVYTLLSTKLRLVSWFLQKKKKIK